MSAFELSLRVAARCAVLENSRVRVSQRDDDVARALNDRLRTMTRPYSLRDEFERSPSTLTIVNNIRSRARALSRMCKHACNPHELRQSFPTDTQIADGPLHVGLHHGRARLPGAARNLTLGCGFPLR
jgi:hypothetical protein